MAQVLRSGQIQEAICRVPRRRVQDLGTHLRSMPRNLDLGILALGTWIEARGLRHRHTEFGIQAQGANRPRSRYPDGGADIWAPSFMDPDRAHRLGHRGVDMYGLGAAQSNDPCLGAQFFPG